MRSDELITYGVADPLAARLATWAQDRGMWRRSISHGKSLRNLLAQGSRGILVVELGRNLVEELTAVRDVAEHYADVPVIVYGDVDHDLIGGLGYDLGAAAVILPPNGVDELFETLTRFADGSAKK